MNFNKKHLKKYLQDNGYGFIDFRRKLGKYGLKALCEYLNSIDDSEYADYLFYKFDKMPKHNNSWRIIKKACGCGYGLIVIDALEAYACKFCSKIFKNAEFIKLFDGRKPRLLPY